MTRDGNHAIVVHKLRVITGCWCTVAFKFSPKGGLVDFSIATHDGLEHERQLDTAVLQDLAARLKRSGSLDDVLAHAAKVAAQVEEISLIEARLAPQARALFADDKAA